MSNHIINILIGEIIGTAILVLLGDGVVAANLLNKSKARNTGAFHIHTGWGLAVFVAAMSTGWIAGAHLNPAITIAFYFIGKVPLVDVLPYILAQFIGAMIGAILVWLAYKQQYDSTEDAGLILGTFSTAPEIRNPLWNIITELIGTLVLVFGALAISDHHNQIAGFGPLFVGFLVWVIGISLGSPTGYAINPARDLGPRIIHAILPIKNKGSSDWEYSWIPVVAPIIGGILGAFLYQLMISLATN